MPTVVITTNEMVADNTVVLVQLPLLAGLMAVWLVPIHLSKAVMDQSWVEQSPMVTVVEEMPVKIALLRLTLTIRNMSAVPIAVVPNQSWK
jgi:hypothetical protein